MAIRFRSNIDNLTADLVAGGFEVKSVRRVRESQGSTHNVFLCSGAVVCWDKESFSLWAEGPYRAVEEVESYLQKRYHGPGFLRQTYAHRHRVARRLRKKYETMARWILCSESMPARSLRHLVTMMPRLRFRRNRSLTSA